MRTPSCVAAIDVLINGQALSTQVQLSPLTCFAICPLLALLLSIPSITSLCALAELSYRRFQVPTLLPFPMRAHKFLLRRGNIHPTLFRSPGPKFDMEPNQPFEQDNFVKTPPCAAAPKSDRGQSVLRDDWNPSQSESSYNVLY